MVCVIITQADTALMLVDYDVSHAVRPTPTDHPAYQGDADPHRIRIEGRTSATLKDTNLVLCGGT